MVTIQPPPAPIFKSPLRGPAWAKKNASSLATAVTRRASGRSDVGSVRAEPFQQALADALASPAAPTADNDGPPLLSRAALLALGCER